MFASRVTETVTLPSDPAVTVTIKKLSWLQRRDAMKQSQHASSRELIAMGGAAFMDVIRAMETPKAVAPTALPAPTVEAAVASVVPSDPVDLAMATHDLLTVLVCGIKAWSVPEPVTLDAVKDLDEADADVLARAILRLSLPPAALETDRKNDDSPSTATSTV